MLEGKRAEHEADKSKAMLLARKKRGEVLDREQDHTNIKGQFGDR